MPQIFPIATRQPGILTSPNKVVPAGAAGHTYLVVTSISQADLDDPAVTFALSMFVSPDGGATWPDNANAGITFVGGPNLGKGGGATVAPGWMQPGDEVVGKTVKFVLNVTGRAFGAGLNADPV